jgi:hypothetical protein
MPENTGFFNGPEGVVRPITHGQDFALGVEERFAVRPVHERGSGPIIGDEV